MPDYITFDKPKVERLRKRYQQAVRDHEEQFIFENRQYLTRYVYYLLQYLDLNLGKGADS